MIYYDVTKMGGKAPRSGLTRLSARLQKEFGAAISPVAWDSRGECWSAEGRAVAVANEDWLLTVELFSEAERPGFTAWLKNPGCRTAALFHDAIPIRFPHITWPHSVRRHPEYMKMLGLFDRVFAISEASRMDIEEFWEWQGVEPRARVSSIVLGADFDGAPRASAPIANGNGHGNGGRASLLCVGIVEPRKNQMFLMDVAEALWAAGKDFDLHVVGRVNPHFGKPIEKRMRLLAGTERRFRYHSATSDAVLAKLYSGARAVVFPTIAEGCGLPLLEALWRGVPCVASDLPVLRENATGGGCLLARLGDRDDWVSKLGAVVAGGAAHSQLRREAMQRQLPRWADTAAVLLAGMRQQPSVKGA